MGFGDNSVDLELRVWITDPVNGWGNVRSAVFLEIWDRFRAHDIEIPFLNATFTSATLVILVLQLVQVNSP